MGVQIIQRASSSARSCRSRGGLKFSRLDFELIEWNINIDMTEMETPVAFPEPRNRSTGALVLFLLFAVPMPICLLIYHFILWSSEQTAIASASQANLAWAGLIGLAVQGIILTRSEV